MSNKCENCDNQISTIIAVDYTVMTITGEIEYYTRAKYLFCKECAQKFADENNLGYDSEEEEEKR